MTSNLREEDLGKFLRPEFINRIDEIMVFNDLSKDVLRDIVSIQIDRLHKTLANQGITLSVNPEIIEYLSHHGYDPSFGARPVNRLIKRKILAPLSKFLLQNSGHQDLTLDLGGDDFLFSSSDTVVKTAM